ncbi:MAG TPA: hypothetical protein VF026_32725, partial [Ktedonobacteraceae bacterium]
STLAGGLAALLRLCFSLAVNLGRGLAGRHGASGRFDSASPSRSTLAGGLAGHSPHQPLSPNTQRQQ